MKPADEQKFNAIRAHVGTSKRFTPRMLPNAIRVSGHWLKKYQGAVVGVFRLCAERDNHLKSWRYYFLNVVDLPPGSVELQDAAESEARFEAFESVHRKMLENEKQLKKIDERAAERAAEAVLAAAPGNQPVQVQKPEYEFESTVNSEGKVVRTLLLNRDGSPREKCPTPAARSVKSANPATVASAPWTPGCGRPFTHADAIAGHQRAGGTQSQKLDMRPRGPLPESWPGQSGPTGMRLSYESGWRQTGPSDMSDPNWRQKL